MTAKRRSATVKKPMRRPAAAHLLVIECDSARLSAQGLSVGSEIAALAGQAFPKKRIVLIQTATCPALLKRCAEVLQEHGRFRSILIVGHSDENGLILTNDRMFQWGAVAEWIRPFSPQFVFLAACDAGHSLPAARFFVTIHSLREVYASPAKVTRSHALALVGLLVQVLKTRRMDEVVLRIVQGLNFVAFRGVLYRWKRAEFRSGREMRARIWDLAAARFN